MLVCVIDPEVVVSCIGVAPVPVGRRKVSQVAIVALSRRQRRDASVRIRVLGRPLVMGRRSRTNKQKIGTLKRESRLPR
jgi:hypothetical protein